MLQPPMQIILNVWIGTSVCKSRSDSLAHAFGYVAGASEEDIMVMLQECSNDVNETTSRLIDSEWPALPICSPTLIRRPRD